MKLESRYRSEIVKAEAELATSTTPGVRKENEAEIANSCNQLAWLLAGVVRKPEEAIVLSERSLILKPDEAIFMDTLARCHFSAAISRRPLNCRAGPSC